MGAVAVDWTAAEVLDVAPSATLRRVLTQASRFASLPQGRRDREELCRRGRRRLPPGSSSAQRLELWRHAALQLTSKPGESERDFRIRVQTAQREARDAAVERSARSSPRSGRRWKRSCAGRNRASRASSSRRRAEASRQPCRLARRSSARSSDARRSAPARSAVRRPRHAGFGRSAKEYEDVRLAQQNVDAATRRRWTTWTRRSPSRRRTSPRAYDADARTREGRPRPQARPGHGAVRLVGVEGEVTEFSGSRVRFRWFWR